MVHSLTPIQSLWLNSRGSRITEDVVVTEKGLYVEMRKDGVDVLVKIPEDKEILKEYDIAKSIKERFSESYAPLVLTRKRS